MGEQYRAPCILAVALLGAATACTLDLGEIPFQCNKGEPKCPDDYECVGGMCVKAGTCPPSVPGCEATDGGVGTDAKSDGPAKPKDGQPKDTPPVPHDTSTVPHDTSTGCTPGASSCVGTDSLKYCDDKGAWKTDTCENLCKAGGYGYADKCEFDPTKAKYVCVCGTYVGFGGLCTNQQKCDPSLICGSFGTSSIGFCTKYCTNPQGVCPGATPPGTIARCILQIQTSSGLQNVCGFDCDIANCPTGMTCDYLYGYCKP